MFLKCIPCWLIAPVLAAPIRAENEPPKEWIDGATGHRVVRISTEPGSASFYFHQNAFTAEGDKMVISTPSGLAAVTLNDWSLEIIVPRDKFRGSGSGAPVLGWKSRRVFYSRFENRKMALYATHLDTKATERLGEVPYLGSFNTVNADETELVGSFDAKRSQALRREDVVPPKAQTQPSDRPRRAGPPAERQRDMRFWSFNVKTQTSREFFSSPAWLNHLQCSPTDPKLLMYCHEGSWQDVDRIWTIPIGGANPTLRHHRTQPNEIAGHEFFSRDGKWIWYDLQTPRSEQFWLAGLNLETGERVRHRHERSEWSVHYNISWDGKLFCGDGGGPNSVANHTGLPEKKRLHPPQNGQWIYLFRPELSPQTTTANGETIKLGKLTAEKLVDLSKHDYSLEPNACFTPDGQWIVFRSNLHGANHVYAVEVAKKPS